MSINDPKKVCESIIALDHEIISVGLLSLSGKEIANASQPSASLLMSNTSELGPKYAPLVISATETLLQGEQVFGELDQIVVVFKRLKAIIIPNRIKQVVAVIVIMREADDKRIAFQASKLLAQW